MGTILYAAFPLSQIPEVIIENDAHPPFSYFFYHFWLLGGQGEAWARLPTVLLGTAVCMLVYVLGRRRVGEQTSLTAMWLVAIAPPSILISQSVRPYMLAAVFTLGAVLCFLKIQEWQESAPLAPFITYLVCATLALYTFYFSLFLLLMLNPYAVCFWWRQWRPLRRWILLQIGVVILYLSWVPSMVEQLFRVSGQVPELPGFFVRNVYMGGVVRAMAGILGVDEALFVDVSLAAAWPRPILYAVALAVLGGACFLMWVGFRGLMAHGMDPAFPWLVLSLVAGPLFLAIVAHFLSGIVLLSRHFYISFALAAFLLAAAIGLVRSQHRRVAILVGLSLLFFVRVGQLYAWPETDWKSAAAYVEKRQRVGDALIYVRDPRALHYFPSELEKIDLGTLLGWTSDGRLELQRLAEQRLQVSPRLWVALMNTYLHRPQNDFIRSWLATHGFRNEAEQSFGSLRVTLYRRPEG